MLHLNYSWQESKKQFAVYESDICDCEIRSRSSDLV